MSTWTMLIAPNPREQTHCDSNPTAIENNENFTLHRPYNVEKI